MAQPATDARSADASTETAAERRRARSARSRSRRPGSCSSVTRVTAHTGPLLSGRMPGIDLSEKGIGQAEGRGERLAALPISAVYASPIERTTQTAERIAAHHGLDVQPLPGVIEADYGDWTGGKIADLAKTDEWKVVQVAPSRARFPGGESLREMQSRMVARARRGRRRATRTRRSSS